MYFIIMYGNDKQIKSVLKNKPDIFASHILHTYSLVYTACGQPVDNLGIPRWIRLNDFLYW